MPFSSLHPSADTAPLWPYCAQFASVFRNLNILSFYLVLLLEFLTYLVHLIMFSIQLGIFIVSRVPQVQINATIQNLCKCTFVFIFKLLPADRCAGVWRYNQNKANLAVFRVLLFFFTFCVLLKIVALFGFSFLNHWQGKTFPHELIHLFTLMWVACSMYFLFNLLGFVCVLA